METVKAIITIAGLILDIILVINLFISFKKIKTIEKESENIIKYLEYMNRKQSKEVNEQAERIIEIIDKKV